MTNERTATPVGGRLGLAALLGALAAAGTAAAQHGTNGEWRVHGGDSGFTRYAPLDQIDADTVGDLQVVWRRPAAHDGFHEGVGGAVALSMTPEYLVEVGLLDQAPPADRDIGLLLRLALDKVAFLPVGLLVDQWRWRVFSGEFRPEAWNEGWWDLRTAVQGVAPPAPRSEADFDPGAEYHVTAAEPHMRHFLAGILQFQFHRALCEAAGREGPLHRCSVFGSRAAGRRLQAMLEIGASRPWPEVLQRGTGLREMDATAVLDYFAPLRAWLDEQNAGRSCGWGGGPGR